VTYAFRSRLLLEVPGQKPAHRTVRSANKLAKHLQARGLATAEAEAVADRLWAARPADAGLSPVRPWETWMASTGLSAWKLLLLGAAFGVGVLFLMWLVAQ
jgi:hypothetical protein